MDKFSEKSLVALGDYYVYGLIDPRTNQIFYIGKGAENRVFEHEKENLNSPNSNELKLKTISEIKDDGLEVKKIIIHSKLSENEAFAAEAALINAFNYISDVGLTNINAGHHSAETLSVDDFEKTYGAEELLKDDIKHNILILKINKLYKDKGKEKITDKELYETVRGAWKLNINRVKTVEYVFGVYNSLIVAVYKPSQWHRCGEAPEKSPKQGKDYPDRSFFIDENFDSYDEYQKFYCGKSISALNLKQQNPVRYLNKNIR